MILSVVLAVTALAAIGGGLAIWDERRNRRLARAIVEHIKSDE